MSEMIQTKAVGITPSSDQIDLLFDVIKEIKKHLELKVDENNMATLKKLLKECINPNTEMTDSLPQARRGKVNKKAHALICIETMPSYEESVFDRLSLRVIEDRLNALKEKKVVLRFKLYKKVPTWEALPLLVYEFFRFLLYSESLAPGKKIYLGAWTGEGLDLGSHVGTILLFGQDRFEPEAMVQMMASGITNPAAYL